MAIQKITAAVLGNNAVTAASVAAGTLSAADIADNSITAAKISASTSPTLGGLDVTGTIFSDGFSNTGAASFNTTGGTQIQINDTDGTNQWLRIAETTGQAIFDARNGASNGEFIFRGFGGGSASEHMRIDSSGNIGLGTTSPKNLSGQKSITINGSVARVDFKIANTFRHAIVTESQYLALSIDPDNTQANSRLAVLVDNTERMRIDSDGNVRIGYNNSLSYPADADLMISNNGQNGIEFSQTAISGENRILNYNRTTSSYIPLNILGSILKVDCPIQFQNSSSNPSTTAEGSVYWNSTDKKFKYYTGSGWVNLTTPDLTAIPGLDVWGDVTEGIAGTTVPDLSGNGAEGTVYDASHVGSLGGVTYYNCNSSSGSWITYDRNDFNDYSGDVTFFFVMTNRSSYNSEGSFITQNYQAATGYHIIRHSGTSDDFQTYTSNGSQNFSTTNTGLPVNASYNEGVIIIFSIGSSSNWSIYKKENGSEGTDTFSSITASQFNFNSNTNAIRIGNSQWAGEYLNAGIFAWGIIDHEITASERQIIYDYYARKGIAV